MSGPALGVGDWVQAWRAEPDGLNDIQLGQVVRISRIVCDPDGICGWDPDCNCAAFWFEGVPDLNGNGWSACCFRPIWRGDKSLIETLLEPVSTDAPRVVEPA